MILVTRSEGVLTASAASTEWSKVIRRVLSTSSAQRRGDCWF
ncbi:hypothetical protein ACLB1R_02610 [Escherichia coli]